MEDGRATRYLWLIKDNGPGYISKTEVRNCSTFFVYKTPGFYQSHCNWRVCTDQGKRCNLD